MPELPDIRLYLDLLRPRLIGSTLRSATIRGVSLLRTFDPPPEAAEGSRVTSLSRLGKRVVISFDNETHFVIHLMIAGRFRWTDAVPRATPVRTSLSKIDQALFTFDTGTLTLTEAGTKKRASLHVVRGPPQCLAAFNPGGLDLFTCTEADFAARIRCENRTLKRALTDPRIIDGVGNAYSDEILHAARHSLMKRTASLTEHECAAILNAARTTLDTWTRTLREEFGLNANGTPRTSPGQGRFSGRFPGRFPGAGQITAFRPGFAVHGKYDQPCPVCGTKVQRILYAENECNYCPRCQTEGRLLADRAMSRLLKGDWPRTIEELEAL